VVLKTHILANISCDSDKLLLDPADKPQGMRHDTDDNTHHRDQAES
jgi:hypothetical protein